VFILQGKEASKPAVNWSLMNISNSLSERDRGRISWKSNENVHCCALCASSHEREWGLRKTFL